jgi:DNA-binding HxlR family transcriptional regulator
MESELSKREGMIMARRESASPQHALDCPVEDWLAFLGHRWNASILWHLQGGSKRHAELAALLTGVTPKVLTERLEGLEARDLIVRRPIATFPRGVAYALSRRGEELVAILDRLELWSKAAEGSRTLNS